MDADQIINWPAWMEQAPCRDADPDLWFPESMDDGDAAAAREVCRDCPVKETCLEYALERCEPAGIWGGLTPAQRTRRNGRTPKRERHRKPRSNLARTHCRHGHEYTEENTVWIDGFRKCRACRAAASQRQKQRIREARRAVA